MKLEYWGKTDVGLKRDNNQDSILVDNQLNLFIVADGMGGHKGGEVASAMAVETLQEVVELDMAGGTKVDPREVLRKGYRESSRRIFIKANRDNPELMGMGTTMVSILVVDRRVIIGNVGDSRAYLFKDGNLWQLTEDHSLVNDQIRDGGMDPVMAEAMIARNVITRSVGFEENVQIDIFERDLQVGEFYLICSDGLCGLVSNDKLSEILKNSDHSQVVDKCIQEAKKAGGDDNISVVCFRVKEV